MSYKQRKLAWNRKIDKAIIEAQELAHVVESIPSSYQNIINGVIDDWYDSYDDRKTDYEPSGNLKHAYQVIFDNKIIKTELDPSLADSEHHQQNSIIYNNAFLRGYHGGSTGKKLKSNIPHYRTGFSFSRWGDPAVKTFSPYQKIEKALNQEQKKKQQEINRKINYIKSILS